jgi:GNAT superfamily N-acetyltransferase
MFPQKAVGLDVGVRQPVGAAALGLRVLHESQIEGGEHQDNADVDQQPFPESILEEQQIYTNNNGYQHHTVKHDRHVLCHFNHQLVQIYQELLSHGIAGFALRMNYPCATMTDDLLIRTAGLPDAPAIASFNQRMALETEGKALIPGVVAAGVLRLLNDPSLGFYVVAEREGKVVGGLMVTNEWSDWRNGLFWWIQSVYVEPYARRTGVYRRLYAFVRQMALANEGICGLRLYVEKENAVAQQTYASLGMAQTDYLVYEELRPGARYFEGS